MHSRRPFLRHLRPIVAAVVVGLASSVLTLLPGVVGAATAADVTDGLMLRYDLTQASGTTVTDSSGNGRDGILTNGGTWTEPVVVDAYPHTVRFRASDMAGNASSEGVLDVPTTLDPAPHPLKPPAVIGKTVVGSTLTGTPGAWDQKGLTFAYQWLCDGVAVPGATGQRFLLTNADVGHRMAVEVTATRPGALPGVARSASTAVITTAKGAATLSTAFGFADVRS